MSQGCNCRYFDAERESCMLGVYHNSDYSVDIPEDVIKKHCTHYGGCRHLQLRAQREQDRSRTLKLEARDKKIHNSSLIVSAIIVILFCLIVAKW